MTWPGTVPGGWRAARRRLVPIAAIATGAILAVALPGVPAAPAGESRAPPPANARFDYQIGGDYPLPPGVRIVARDWFSGSSVAAAYSICYVNAFQTQDDEDDVDRPDERFNWPPELVLEELGDDPNWGGEYLIDISSAGRASRSRDRCL